MFSSSLLAYGICFVAPFIFIITNNLSVCI